jgi:hypothetical protein
LTVHPSKSPRPRHTPRTQRGRVTYHREQPDAGPSQGIYLVAFLILLAVAVLCLAAFVLARILLPSSGPGLVPSFATWTPVVVAPEATVPQPSPTVHLAADPQLVLLNPQQGYLNTLLTVSGQGWWPGEPVFIFLRSPDEGDGRGYSYAAAMADDRGIFRADLTFPNETRWTVQAWADVIARGTRSGQEGIARFRLLSPTFTPTTLPPTAQPTQLPTSTPEPTADPLPTDTPAPTVTQEPAIVDWRGEYFAGPEPGGEPVLVRNDYALDFNWGLGSPGWGIPDDRFSVQWTRRQYFDEGSYRFTVMADDGVRIRIDGQIVLDEWHESTQETYEFDAYLASGEHSVHVDYYEHLGGARAFVDWALLAQPQPWLTPTQAPQATPTEPSSTLPLPTRRSLPIPPVDAGWRAEYYDNISLSGQPVVRRLDPALDFDWGTGSPALSLPPDDFSARWTRNINLPANSYRFYLQADDGARFWLDGQLLIDAWPAQIGNTYVVEAYVPGGTHLFEVEYFEVTIDAMLRFWTEAVP